MDRGQEPGVSRATPSTFIVMIVLSAAMMSYSVWNGRAIASVYWAALGTIHTALLMKWHRA